MPTHPRSKTLSKAQKILPLIKVVGGILLNNQNSEVLVAKRALDKNNGGFWEFPGGKVEPGESNEAALSRELHEELGVKVKVLDFLCTHIFASEFVRIELHCYFCEVVSGNLQALEHAELRFCPSRELQSLEFTPANSAALALVTTLLQTPPVK